MPRKPAKGIRCRHCGSSNVTRNGHNRNGVQQYACKNCGKRAQLTLAARVKPAKGEIVFKTSWQKVLANIDKFFPLGGEISTLSTVEPLEIGALFRNHRVKGHKM